MRRSFWMMIWLSALVLHLGAQTPSPATGKPATGLVWDALTKEATAKAGETDIPFTFAVTNHAASRITIERVDTSCGCTIADIPSEPWPLNPGEGGLLKVEFDARGKSGTLTKTIYVFTSTGQTELTIKVHLPEVPPSTARDNSERVTNLMLASKNRQAVFQGKCITCHVTPTIGKMGKELYTTACGICHDAEHRASMVKDLKALTYGTTKTHWEHWTRNGKPMSLMPAFEQKQGGPLTEAQIKSLVEYLSTSKEFPSNVTIPATPTAKP